MAASAKPWSSLFTLVASLETMQPFVIRERLVKLQCTTRLAESAFYSIIMIFMGNTPCAGNYQSKKFLDQLDEFSTLELDQASFQIQITNGWSRGYLTCSYQISSILVQS